MGDRRALAEQGWGREAGSNVVGRPLRAGVERRTGQERRKRPRPRVLNVTASSPCLEFALLEISPYGLSIETPHPVTIGRTYPLTIRHKQATSTVDGRVVWCKLYRTLRVGVDDFEPLYRAGLELDGSGIRPLAVLGPVGL